MTWDELEQRLPTTTYFGGYSAELITNRFYLCRFKQLVDGKLKSPGQGWRDILVKNKTIALDSMLQTTDETDHVMKNYIAYICSQHHIVYDEVATIEHLLGKENRFHRISDYNRFPVRLGNALDERVRKIHHNLLKGLIK